MTKKNKPKRKWLLPATCEMCNRTCTEFWGECADMWGCEGHYHIMRTNSDSWGFNHYPEYQAWSKVFDDYTEDIEGELTIEQSDELKATKEYKAWMEGPIYKEWASRVKQGQQWLKDNPEPESPPTCSFCEEEARCHDKEEFYCMEHWPLEEEE